VGGVPEVVGHELPPKVFKMLNLPAANDKIKDELLALLRQSQSLDYDEKLRVIDAMPTLSAFQIERLISVFNEERLKFTELKGYFDNQSIVSGSKVYLNTLYRRDSEWVALNKTLLRRLFS